MTDFSLKQGDTLPILRIEFADDLGPINLTAVSGKFNYRKKGTTAVTSRDLLVTSAVSGIAEYRWVSGDTANAGTYMGEFVLYFADKTERSFPSDSYVVYEIMKEI